MPALSHSLTPTVAQDRRDAYSLDILLRPEYPQPARFCGTVDYPALVALLRGLENSGSVSVWHDFAHRLINEDEPVLPIRKC